MATKLSQSAEKRKGLANAIDSVVNVVTRAPRSLREIKKTKNQRIAEAEDKFKSGSKMVVDAIAERNKNSPKIKIELLRIYLNHTIKIKI